MCVCAHVYDCIMEVGHSGGGSRLVTQSSHILYFVLCVHDYKQTQLENSS